ncbi:hypothetical protein HMH01_05745 [Halovulum dunhuangense]|uniref:Uncharacterized protein n=1 Tax=Halovulum dunhuangense TaxID=1505036 RepID=A0A849L0X7_9RHOB|nr:hypothetical protein [Halovulum dunhuangense]
MSGIERQGDGFVVDATLLAEAFGLKASEVRTRMRDGRIVSRCETGMDQDAGRWRLSFYHEGRACRFTVDEAGTILKRSTFDAPARKGTGGPE